MQKAILSLDRPLQAGIAAKLTQFVYANNGEIVDFDQYVDTEQAPRLYFARIEWALNGFAIEHQQIKAALEQELGSQFQLQLNLKLVTRPAKIAIMVTKQLPCFYGILTKILSNEWYAEVCIVVSNRMDMEVDAKRFDLSYHYLPITPDTRVEQGNKAMAIWQEQDIDLVVLAKYMQIIPENVMACYSREMINIYHSMLPAFVGAKPYHQAREYGVKFIGATAHYVSEMLDEGPIITQNVKPISHKQTAKELVSVGKSIETETLLRAIQLHLEHRVIISGRRSIIFE